MTPAQIAEAQRMARDWKLTKQLSHPMIRRIAITTAALDAETLICSQWQDIHICTGANGYVSHETQWQGMTIGEDNRGNRWTRSDWQGREIITVTSRQER